MTARRFTSSELREWQTCRRTWYLKYHLGYGSKRRDADGEVGVARTGTLVHLGLETYYASGDEAAALDAIEETVQRNLDALTEAGRESQLKGVQGQGELARIMVEGYFEWLADEGADADLLVMGAEKEIEAPLPAELFGREVTLLGKADLLAVRKSTGKRLILDTKTVQSASDQEILAPMSPQFKHYATILRMNSDDPVEGALVRWLRRVKRTARATPPFYGEVPVFWPKTVLRTYYRNTMSLIGEILRAEDALARGERPEDIGIGPTVGRDCARCLFRPVCPLLDDETADETDVLRWSYEKRDPLERYSNDQTEEEE